MWNIRPLRANEIEVRPQIVKEGGFTVLLYKDARADMNVLDDTFGPSNWQRRHMVINNNLFCSVLIWDDEKKEWIEKQDVGVPSNTEKEKGEASDSFKRACTNVGIGRELYTAPFIWIRAQKDEITGSNGKYRLDYKVKIHVHRIEYADNKISFLQLADNDGTVRFTYPMGGQQNAPQQATKQNNRQDEKEAILNELVDFVNIKKIPSDQISGIIHTNFRKNSTKDLSQKELEFLLNMVRELYGSN